MPPVPRSPKKAHSMVPLDVPQTCMMLASADHGTKMMNGLQTLRENRSLCDFSLIAGGEVFPVHRAVLAACSDYFHIMLTGDMRESREDQVELKGVTAGGLRMIVDFAYTGILNLDPETAEDALAAATHLQVSDAVILCSTYLEAAVTTDNCVDVLNLSEIYNLTSTHIKARHFMLENFESIAECDQYHKLTHSQLASLLTENCLRIPSECCLFDVVNQWIEFDRDEREQYACELMNNVRLPLLSGEELVDHVSRVPLMKQNTGCLELLTAAKDYHIVTSKQPLLQSPRTQVRSNRKSLVMCNATSLETYTLETQCYTFLKECIMPLYNPCVAVMDNFMYVCGGKYDNTSSNEIATARCFRYDPRNDKWFELPSMTEARKDFAMVVFDNHLYAIAGQDEDMVMGSVECFSIENNEWIMKDSMTKAVYGHAAALHNNKIYISGGQKFVGICNIVLSYTPSLDVWESCTSMHNARSNHVMLNVSDILYALGGNIEDAYGFAVPVITVEQYSVENDQWTLCRPIINIREAGSCTLDDKIYIVGGINGEHYYSDLVQMYDPKRDEIEVIEKFPSRISYKACCILALPQYI